MYQKHPSAEQPVSVRRVPSPLRKPALLGGGLAALFVLAACSPSSASSDGFATQNAAALSATRTGSVTGTLTSSDPADPITEGAVAAVLYDSTADTQLYTAPVNASGAYTLTGVAPGTYTLFFSGGGQHADEWFDNLPTSAGAKPVAVTSGKARSIADVELKATPSGSVSGTVTGASPTGAPGTKLVDVEVRARDSAGTETSVRTGVDGRYSLDALPPGSYRLHFAPPANRADLVDQWYDGASTEAESKTISVTVGGSLTAVDAKLHGRPTETISGSVSARFRFAGDSSEVSGAEVRVFDADGKFQSAVTDSHGRFTLSNVIPGAYKLQFLPPASRPDLSAEWYNDKPNQETSNELVVPAGGATTFVQAELRPDPSDHGWDSDWDYDITGEAKVGETLSLDVGPWKPTPTAVEFQWIRDDGLKLTSSSPDSRYTPTPADVGHKLTITVRISKPGFFTAGDPRQTAAVVR